MKTKVKCIDCAHYKYIQIVGCGFCSGHRNPLRVCYGDELKEAPCKKYKQKEKMNNNAD